MILIATVLVTIATALVTIATALVTIATTLDTIETNIASAKKMLFGHQIHQEIQFSPIRGRETSHYEYIMQ